MIPMTAEKEKAPVDDREFLQSMTCSIMEELSKADMFKELVQKGIRSMTLKNFVMILHHFISSICTIPKDFETNYIDFLHNLLLQLEYPYSINKSSLKTPNAPHCMNSIIILLGWLAEFSKLDDDLINYKTTEELPDQALTLEFMKYTSDAYYSFNQEKETDDIENKISTLYLEMRAGPGSDVVSEISRLKFETEQMKKEIKPLSMQKELNEKQKLSQELDAMIEAHNKNISGFNRRISNLKAESSLKRDAEENAARDLQLFQHTYKNQKMTIDTRRDLLVEITQLKSALSSKRNAIIDISETSAENEIALSNVIARKINLIDSLNNLLFKLSSDLEIAGVHNTFDPTEFLIEATKNDQHTNKMIERLHGALKTLKNQYSSVLAMIKEDTIKIEAEVHALKTQNELYEIQVRNMTAIFEQLEDEEAAVDEELTILMQNIQLNYNERKEQIEKTRKEITERHKGLRELEEDVAVLIEKRIAFGAKAVAECREQFEKKKAEVENRRLEVRKRIAAIDEYERNKKPLPEDLQEILDEVMERKKIEEELDRQ
jgi:kinetochore protein NDC80